MGILTVWSSGKGVGVGDGCCAQTDNAAPPIMKATDKYLNKKRVTATDMNMDKSLGAAQSLLETGGFDALEPELVALSDN